MDFMPQVVAFEFRGRSLTPEAAAKIESLSNINKMMLISQMSIQFNRQFGDLFRSLIMLKTLKVQTENMEAAIAKADAIGSALNASVTYRVKQLADEVTCGSVKDIMDWVTRPSGN